MAAEQVPLYDSFGAEYDVMVSWPGRLEREGPFLRQELDRVGARRVLDVGCATGGHAIHLAGQGFQTVGADPSEAMLARARANSTGREGVNFVRAGFGQLASALPGSTFDAALCLGNTLPHALGQAGLLAALRDIAAVLRPGGLLVVQQLNYDRVLSQGQRFLGLSSGRADDVEYLFFRFYDYAPGQLTFNMVIMRRDSSGQWQQRVESTPLQPILSTQLGESLRDAGFTAARLYGSYERESFAALSSNDLLLIAERGSGA
ncbi:MAG: class I SAM-dependent methyltransferase [Chloroflexota bacterium]